MINPNQSTHPYPKIMYRWIADILTAGQAYSQATLAILAVEKGILRKEHAQVFRIMAGRYMQKAGIAAEASIIPHGVPLDAWSAETWQKVLYEYAPAPTRRLKFRFLITKAVDGELSHASSLACLITAAEVRRVGANNIKHGRHEAYRWLSRFRRDLIKVEKQGMRSIQSSKNITATYPAWDAAVWKSAAEIPGYYGLHMPVVHGEYVEALPEMT